MLKEREREGEGEEEREEKERGREGGRESVTGRERVRPYGGAKNVVVQDKNALC